jgi:hypothetical protein
LRTHLIYAPLESSKTVFKLISAPATRFPGDVV